MGTTTGPRGSKEMKNIGEWRQYLLRRVSNVAGMFKSENSQKEAERIFRNTYDVIGYGDAISLNHRRQVQHQFRGYVSLRVGKTSFGVTLGRMIGRSSG